MTCEEQSLIEQTGTFSSYTSSIC